MVANKIDRLMSFKKVEHLIKKVERRIALRTHITAQKELRHVKLSLQ